MRRAREAQFLVLTLVVLLVVGPHPGAILELLGHVALSSARRRPDVLSESSHGHLQTRPPDASGPARNPCSGSFAFRKYAATLSRARLFGAIFTISSAITPFFLAAGAPAALQGLLVAVGLAVVIVVPALGYLYKLTQSEVWSHHGS